MSIAGLILKKSKERRKLLGLFFLNPEKEYYMREIEKITGISVGNVRRELKRLNEDRLFLTNARGNLKFYRLNKAHPYFGELTSILYPVLGIEKAITDSIADIKGIDCAFIYGSYAKETERSDSDIDLFIIGNPKRLEVIKSLSELEGRLSKEINFKILGKKTFKEKRRLKNSFILNILKNPKIMLIGDLNEP